MADEKEKRFLELAEALQVPSQFDRGFLYSVFCYALEGSDTLKQANPALSKLGVDPAQLILYLVHEHAFYLACHPELKEKDLFENEEYYQFLTSVAVDKYFTNQHLAYSMGSLTNPYDPSVSTMELYLNFILGMLSRYKQGDPKQTLLVDIMNKGFQMAKCVTSLLENGFETEAFSTWRTLHENECILHCLIGGGSPVIESYLRHMKYAVAFRGGLSSKEETDQTFVQIKDEMKAHDLKSKDMKRFIEYGWLYEIKDIDKIEGFKLNFRDGVERVAGLSNYSKVYEMSSEIAHSSPLLIYSRKNYFYLITILNLYESFFRLEKVFSSLFMATVGEGERERYVKLRSLYFNELLACYNMNKNRFSLLSKK